MDRRALISFISIKILFDYIFVANLTDKS